MIYNENGVEAEDEDRAFAKENINEFGSTYQILYHGADIVDPGNMPRRNPDRIRFRSVTEQAFRGYISFLKGREQRKLRELKRIQHI